MSWRSIVMWCAVSPAPVPPALSRDSSYSLPWGSPQVAALTIDVNCAADVGAAQGVGHLAGHRL